MCLFVTIVEKKNPTSQRMYATNRKEDESRGCFLHLHRPFAAKQHVLRLLIREVQLLLAEHEVERLRLARSQRNTRKVREALQRIALLSSLPFTPSTHSYQRRLHKQQNALVSLTTSRVGHFHVHVDRQRGAESVIPNLPNLHGVGERRVGQAEAERMNHRTREEPIRSSRESRFLCLNRFELFLPLSDACSYRSSPDSSRSHYNTSCSQVGRLLLTLLPSLPTRIHIPHDHFGDRLASEHASVAHGQHAHHMLVLLIHADIHRAAS